MKRLLDTLEKTMAEVDLAIHKRDRELAKISDSYKDIEDRNRTREIIDTLQECRESVDDCIRKLSRYT